LTRHCCDEMASALSRPDTPIDYWPNCREYVLVASDDVGDVIPHCPWCGSKLPESLRDERFDRLEALGVNWIEDDVPHEYQSDRWWRNAGL
jgi:hypothetical protein